MGGWFRIRDDPQVNDSLVYYQEGVGSCVSFIEGDYRFWEPTTPWEEIENNGHGMISPWYLPGYVRQGGIPRVGFACTGWLTVTDDGDRGLRRLATRPARLLRWAHDNMADGGGSPRPFGYLGHSAGAMAGFAAFYWGAGMGLDVDDRVDAWVLSGGPIPWDLRLLCGDQGDNGAYIEGLSGMCEDDPRQDCPAQLTAYWHPAIYATSFTWAYDYFLGDPSLPCSTAALGQPTRTEPGLTRMVQSSYRDIDPDIQFPVDIEPRGPMIILAGDAHMVAIDDGSNSPGGVPIMQAGAVSRS